MRKSLKNYTIVFGFVGMLVLCLTFASKVVTYEPLNDKDMGSIKVSVVVPVYNTEKYVGEFLDSLENQTLKEIEIICVNDGSTDNTLQVLKNHQQKDSRIKIIEQKNAGVSAARNRGIRDARGTYMVFADSDDIIPPYAYEKAYKDAVKYNVNLVSGNIMTFKDGESIDINQLKYDESKVKRCAREKHQSPFYYMAKNTGYVVTKLFKRSFVTNNNLFFKEGVTHYEDALFNLLSFPLIYEMVQDDNVFYCARLNRPNSAVYSFNAKKVLSSSLKVAQELIDHHDLFNFRKADEWILDKIMDINYLHITKDTKEPELKKYYAEKLVELLEENYFKKYDIKVSQGIQDKISELKVIAAG